VELVGVEHSADAPISVNETVNHLADQPLPCAPRDISGGRF
jgi:hypothetical protein